MHYYNYLKSVHIIFVVSWMAGLFYIVRLFVYHTEANDKPEPESGILKRQFVIMERRLWNIITTPAMILTVVSGLWMMIDYQWYKQPWMMVKLAFVTGLLTYHFMCQRIMKQLEKNVYNWSSPKLRMWNELATLFLVAIVFTVVLKNAVNWMYGTIGFIVFGILILIAVKVYKRMRSGSQ
jgi:putative membrane protein